MTATGEHAPAVAAIYDDAAHNSYATFDLTGHPESWWREAIDQQDPAVGHTILVALADDGEVIGYAKAGRHKERPAYDTTCETSVYVARSARSGGAGRALYDLLLERLDLSPLRLAVAGVAEPNEASTRLHLASGFKPVGTFSGAGAKRGRAWDVTWFERPLAAPALVERLRRLVAAGEGPGAAAEAIAAHLGRERVSVGTGSGAVPILDPADGSALGAIDVGEPLGRGDRLLLEWCAEEVAPLL